MWRHEARPAEPAAEGHHAAQTRRRRRARGLALLEALGGTLCDFDQRCVGALLQALGELNRLFVRPLEGEGAERHAARLRVDALGLGHLLEQLAATRALLLAGAALSAAPVGRA